MDRIYSLAIVMVICFAPGPVLAARDGAISKMETSPCPHGVHILVKGGGHKVVNDSSTQALHAGGPSPEPWEDTCLSVCVPVCMPWGPLCFGGSWKESMVWVGSPGGVR